MGHEATIQCWSAARCSQNCYADPAHVSFLYKFNEHELLKYENRLGVWEFRSKSKQNSCSLEGGCRGYMFALEVTEELESWAEQTTYKRKWLSPEEAYKFCRYEWMRDALEVFLAGIKKDRMSGRAEKLADLPMFPAADALAEHQMSLTKCIVQG
ncbi:hypothetical protein SCA6_007145 [Theobroma cacao]